jgi:hypothetical protein
MMCFKPNRNWGFVVNVVLLYHVYCSQTDGLSYGFRSGVTQHGFYAQALWVTFEI